MQIVSPNDITQIVKLLQQGKIVVLPTDTCYGLMGKATDEKVVRRIYEIKGRDFKKPISILCRDLEMIRKFAVVSEQEEKIIRKFLPGPLTIVLRKKSLIKPLKFILRKKELPKILNAGQNTVGVRVPKYPLTTEIMKQINFSLTATSANQSNEPEIYSSDEILAKFKEKTVQPDAIVMAGHLARVLPSTVIRVEKNDVQVLRRGPIKKEEILKYI